MGGGYIKPRVKAAVEPQTNLLPNIGGRWQGRKKMATNRKADRFGTMHIVDDKGNGADHRPRRRGGKPPESRKPAVICDQVDRLFAEKIRNMGCSCLKAAAAAAPGNKSIHARAVDINRELNTLAYNVQFGGGGDDMIKEAGKKYSRFLKLCRRAIR